MANLVADKKDYPCIVNGRKMTGGEVLVAAGLITQAELDDAVAKGPYSYQLLNAGQNSRILSFNNLFDMDRPKDAIVDKFQTNVLKGSQYSKDHFKYGGPKLSQNELRKVWKKAKKYSDKKEITGGDDYLQFQRDKLDLYSSSEKKALKEQRKQDVKQIKYYEYYIEERKNSF